MGTPACRITDQTAHGGVVMVGCPTVLIGMMPASRIGDNHLCPMVTPGVPPIPHVGGPFILGSPTVLVSGMPQSRVTDQLVCVGPPDIAIKGEPTVLVGMAGAGGMMGAMSGLQAMGASVPMQPAVPSPAEATLLSDGTMQTAATAPGASLPAITLQQPGWPDLPPENTVTFQSVQPVTLPAGTTLYAPTDDTAGGASYWSPEPPAASDADSSASDWNRGDQVATMTVSSNEGVKAWMGQPAGSGYAAPLVWIRNDDGSVAVQRAPEVAG